MGSAQSHSSEPFLVNDVRKYAIFKDDWFAEGNSRYVYRGRIYTVNGGWFEGGEQCVVKLYKEEYCKRLKVAAWKADDRASFKAHEMAVLFNYDRRNKDAACIQILIPHITKVKTFATFKWLLRDPVPKIVRGSDAKIKESADQMVPKDAAVAIQPFLQGQYVKFLSNSGYVNPSVDTLVPVAFSHFTYHESDGEILVTDLQGVYNQNSYIFTDPAIHSTEKHGKKFGYFGPTDLGVFGVIRFFKNHKCNCLCEGLLKPDTSRIPDHVKGELDQAIKCIKARSGSRYTYELQEEYNNIAEAFALSGRHDERLRPNRTKGAQSEAATYGPTTTQQEAQISAPLAATDPETTVSNTRPGRLKAQPSFPEYRMNRNPRGLCMIINNVIFEGSSEPRRGSEIDKGKLDNLFNKLHFQVEVKENLTAHAMFDWFKTVSTFDHSCYDCFACCVMTHGQLGKVFGTDGKALEIQHILGLFTGVSCQSLVGKPKLFFIQACQGSSIQEGVQEIETDEPCGLGAGIPKTLPSEADFLLSYSTVPGYVAYRNPTQGSWYVSALVDEISNHHSTTDMLNILTKVNKTLCDRIAKTEQGIGKQVSALSCTLAQALYLRSLVK